MLQHIADSFSPGPLIARVRKWLAYLTPFFTKEERNEHGCHHRLFVAQIEYCHNLIFRRRAVLDALQERLLDEHHVQPVIGPIRNFPEYFNAAFMIHMKTAGFTLRR